MLECTVESKVAHIPPIFDLNYGKAVFVDFKEIFERNLRFSEPQPQNICFHYKNISCPSNFRNKIKMKQSLFL